MARLAGGLTLREGARGRALAKALGRDRSNESKGTDKDSNLTGLMRSAQDGDSKRLNVAAAERSPAADDAADLCAGLSGFLQPPRCGGSRADILPLCHAGALHLQSGARPFVPWLMPSRENRMADGARRYARRAANEVVSDRAA